jgi:predicted NBD/HSP70 family sugar kinase
MLNSLNKATHQQTKIHNRQLVLSTIYDSGKISRAEIARSTCLTKVTVSEIVAALIQAGLVDEVELRPSSSSSGGKSSILLSVIDDAFHMIGVELGSNEWHAAITNLRGEIQHSMSEPLKMQDGHASLNQLYAILDGLIPLTDRPLLGISIGVPGVIDSPSGIVRQAVNVGWVDVPLSSLLSDRYHIPAYIINDSRARALAELTFGAGRGENNLAVVKIGRGIAAGIIINGQLYLGDNFGAGEIGHISFRPGGLLCNCGQRGCLETVASSIAITRRMAELTTEHPGSYLGLHLAQVSDLTLEDIIEAFQAGDQDAQTVGLEAAQAVGLGIACLIGVLNIRRVLLVGSVTRFGDVWLQTVIDQIRSSTLPTLIQNMNISFGVIHPHGVVLGACALLMSHEIGVSLAR